MNSPARTLWGLVAVGAATAVGVTTRDAGFTVITLIGSLALPRILGFGGRHHRHGPGAWAAGCAKHGHGRSRLEERLDAWHRTAHGDVAPTGGDPATGAAQA